MRTLGERLIDWLEVYEVNTVFGIPGVHTVELYRGLADSKIHHVTPRHEQGAGFMADGYARVTGKPGVAFVITGPGLTNILTPMAQAYADSIPMLVISSVNSTRSLGMDAGDLHEIRNQSLIAAQASAFSHMITHPDQLPEVLARAWAVFKRARPRPVHIQIPLDLLGEGAQIEATPRAVRSSAVPDPDSISAICKTITEANRPLMIYGGGLRDTFVEASILSDVLNAPVITTTNARGKAGPPLEVPASPSLESIRAALSDADVVLAIGSEFGRTDYDMYDRAPVSIPGRLIRVDIDPQQLARPPVADIALTCDARAFCAALAEAAVKMLAENGDETRLQAAEARAEAMRRAARDEIGPRYRRVLAFLESVRDALPEAPMVCDSTQAAYAGNLYFRPARSGQWFNAATGYGALGYGLPAAIGAARGLNAPVVCIAGDGGVQFTLADLGTAVEEKLPVILLVWNNQGYGEIKDHMVSRQIKPVGVDLHTPDFVAIGRAYGCHAEALCDLAALPDLLRTAAGRAGPTLIEIDEVVILG